MIETVQANMLKPLAFMYEAWKEKGDVENSAKLLDVMKKYANRQFMIAFCGHFSAGKSTMMNYLYGSDLLPTSPIPTSANVVKIQKGADKVVLTLKSGEVHSYEGTYTDVQLKELCKNGDEVIGIHIYRNDAALPDGVMLVDTPGIDSTDDAHQLATESALHVADVIFYMMDYNHVQSEVNLQFVKELKQRQKKVYLVINQIDKHKEEELSFQAYRHSVSESFANWNIETDGTYYTSLRKKDHPHNELARLEQLLSSIVGQRDAYMTDSMRKEAEYLLREHLQYVAKQNEQKTKAASSMLSRASHSLEEIDQKLSALYEEEADAAKKEKNVKLFFEKEIDAILNNAYLMPFEVRDLAGRYLETQLSNFKVGFLFSKGKTEKEKEARLLAFYEKLKQTVDTQLAFHIKEYILSFLKEEGVYSEQIAQRVYDIGIPFDPSSLASAVKQGAGLTGDYVLNYTNDVASLLKREYRNAAVSFLEEHLSLILEEAKRELERIRRHIGTYSEYKQALEVVREQEEAYATYETSLYDVWEGKAEAVCAIDIEEILQEEPLKVADAPALFAASEQLQAPIEPYVAPEVKQTTTEKVQAIIEHVKGAETAIAPIHTLRHLFEEIEQKRKRVETRQFTVALFGAFSAGKSSFANALLGDQVLPVSPNPTTATINKILPVTEERGHGTVLIQLKSKATLFEDLQGVYKLFETSISTLEEGLARMDELLHHPSPTGRQKTTFSFLRAVRKGTSAFLPKLGEMLQETLEEFASYVANEEKSCFIEYMELYYDCEFTRKGITLVDTPGADSINARHTDVAFQYIKNADAILFVTYYNHVFSRADREFLIQLGRVKDSFAMDKMFFLINAADLAQSNDELRTVKDYISSQLLQYGIRNPRLFAVSSLFALDEKKGSVPQPGQYGILQQSGIALFEESFTSFTMRDLMVVSLTLLQSALQGTNRLLAQMIANALEGNEQKEERKKRYEAERASVMRIIASHSVLTEEKALEQEIRELLYYVKQRVFFRYNDVFIEFFNPATLRTDSGDVKQKLRECTAELLDFLRNDLQQEMRATSLRVEKWMNNKLHFSKDELEKGCRKENEELSFSALESFSPASAVHVEPFQQFDMQQFKKSWGYFRNAKSFFENNEKAMMQEEMKKLLDPFVSAYVQEEQRIMQEHYEAEWKRAWSAVKASMQEDAAQYYDGILYVLSEKIDVSLYKQAKDALQWRTEAVEAELASL